MDQQKLVAWFLVAVGLFSFGGGLFDWDWFMNHRKTRLWLRLFGRNGTRIFYGLLGAGISVLGLLLALGVIAAKK